MLQPSNNWFLNANMLAMTTMFIARHSAANPVSAQYKFMVRRSCLFRLRSIHDEYFACVYVTVSFNRLFMCVFI